MTEQWGGRRAQALTRMVLERDAYVCRMPLPNGQMCGARATTADHVIPIALGGPMWDPTNLRAACRPCNVAAGARLGNRRRMQRRAARAQTDAPATLPPSRSW